MTSGHPRAQGFQRGRPVAVTYGRRTTQTRWVPESRGAFFLASIGPSLWNPALGRDPPGRHRLYGVKLSQVVNVLGLLLIVGVELALLSHRQAVDPAAVERASRERTGRVVEMRTIKSRLAAMTVGVELHGVHVDPPIVRGSQLDPYGQPVRLGDVTEIVECEQACLQVIRVDREIKVPMVAGLPPDQGRNTPAAADPVAHPRLIKGIKHPRHFLKEHITEISPSTS